jgi:serine/threonine protein kinase/WD40 repeat protein
MTMVRNPETEPKAGIVGDTPGGEPIGTLDHDERVGEAIEAYLALAEGGNPPDPEAFAARYPDLSDDLLAALEGLALVRGLVGAPDGGGPGGRLETGRRVAGYRIVRELGRGGMGVVYEAVHVGLDRPVALKVLGTHAAPDSNGRRRFLNEARTAAGLHHTHIVPVFDVGQVGGLCYYAMQRIEGSGLDRVVRHLRSDRPTAAGSLPGAGSSLRSWTRLKGRSKLSRSRPEQALSPIRGSESETGTWHGRSGTRGLIVSDGESSLVAAPRSRHREDEPPPFDPPRGTAYYRWVAEIGRAAAEALGHAHQRGVIHRDVKPSNLLVDGRGFVWVGDFGLARRLADPGMTQHDSLLGTPRYMSPEQARPGPIDGRSDLFSLGATLFELLTLRPPFEGRSAAELVEQIAGQEPPSPRQFDPRIPRDLETIILKLLAKRPGDRYATAGALSDDLTRFLNYEPVKARRISPLGRVWRFSRRHPSVSIVSTAATVAILAVSTYSYLRVLHERDEAEKARDIAKAAQSTSEKAMGETKTANLALRAEMRNRLLHSATVTRFSTVPDRRTAGLGLIKDAAGLGPDPELRLKLRNEAIEFLVMRDVEARAPFPTGRARGIAFGPQGARLAAITPPDDGGWGASIEIWDVARRARLFEHGVQSEVGGSARREERGQGGRNGGGGPNGGPRPGRGPIAFSATDESLAVAAPDFQGVRLFDPLTATRQSALKMPGHRIFGVVLVPPSGQRMLTLEFSPTTPKPSTPLPPNPPDAMEVNLWDTSKIVAPLATLMRLEADPNASGRTFPLVSVSPDGKTVAVASALKKDLTLYSADTGQALGTVDTQIELTSLALGPDNLLATAGGGEVRLFDIESKLALSSFSPNKSSVTLLRFSPQGSLLAVVGFGGRDVELWDTAAHAVVAILPTPDRLDDIAFSPDGRTLAASSVTGGVSVWEVVEPEVRVRFAGFDGPTRSLAFRPDGLLALGLWKGTMRFWNAGRPVNAGSSPNQTEGIDRPASASATAPADGAKEEPPVRDRAALLAFDDRGRMITLEQDALRVLDAPPRCMHSSLVPLPESKVMAIAPLLASSADGRTMALARGSQVVLWHPGQNAPPVVVKPPPAPARSQRPPGGPRSGGGGANRPGPVMTSWSAIAVSPEGDRLYLSTRMGEIQGWAFENGEGGTGAKSARRLTLPDLPPDGTCLALSVDGRWLAIGNRLGSVTVIDTTTNRTRLKLPGSPGGTEGSVSALAFSPDGKELAVGSEQGPIGLWVLDDPTAPLVRLPGHRGKVTSLAFDAQGHHLASAVSDKTVDVWDLEHLGEAFERLGLAW